MQSWGSENAFKIDQSGKPYLYHLFPVGFWVERSFCQQNWVFLGRYTKLVVEGVMPDLIL